MSALVELTSVSKRYADAPALHSTNLSIEQGQTTVLIGPSGCGKSTLLRLIIRLVEPDSGTINFEGAPVTPDNIERVLPNPIARRVKRADLEDNMEVRRMREVTPKDAERLKRYRAAWDRVVGAG